jgi:hypothetical protein
VSWLSDIFMRRKVTGIVKDAQEGKKGEMAQGAIESFKGSPGYRLLLLVAEGIAKAAGFETGPMFMLLRTAFGAIGVNPTEATSLGVDPEQLVAGLIAVWFAVSRLRTVYCERKAAKAAEAAAHPLAPPAPPPSQG